MYYLYILYSVKRGRFYTGHCEDVGDRFVRHNKGRSKATKSGVPWVLVYSQAFETRSEAIHREREIKSMKSRKYIVDIIGFDPDFLAATGSSGFIFRLIRKFPLTETPAYSPDHILWSILQ